MRSEAMKWVAGALALAVVVLGSRCGGGQPTPYDPDASGGSISGVVVKGRVAGATVTAYGLDSVGGRKVTLGSAVTDELGAFKLGLPSYNGPLLLVATGGAYPEEAVANATIRLESSELTYLVSDYQSNTALTAVAVTPVSHLAAGLALRWVEADGKPVADAGDEAWMRLNNHFGALVGGGLDWRRVAPADFTNSGAGQLDGAGRAGLILAGLSMEARTYSERAGLTPGAGVTSLSLVQALYDDVRADGFFDGLGASGPLVLPSGGFVADAGPSASPLDASTARDELARAIERFIESDRNATPLTVNDALPLLNELSSNADARLFRSSGVAYDHAGPTLAVDVRWKRADGVLHQPVLPGALVGGTVLVTVTATDDSTIMGLSLAVNGAPVTVAQTGSGGSLQGTAEVLTSADGPLILAVSSADVYGNASSTTRQHVVDNTPPTISVASDSPSTTAYYSTIIPINVTAADANGVTSFSQSGLSGFVNLSGSTAQLSGTWTVPANQPDGTLPVTLTAVDSVSNVATTALPLRIDRTPPVLTQRDPQPPRYTSASSVTVHVAAADVASGVGLVLASINGGPSIPGVQDAGGWDVQVPLGLDGPSLIRVWGIDQAVPVPNSSYNSALQVLVTHDTLPPAPAVVSVPSYFDERPTVRGSTPYAGMELQVDASGNPLVPAAVKFSPGATKVGIVGATAIYKAAGRLSWGAAPPSAADLYAQDGVTRNVPFLVFDVPVGGSEAPLQPAATFTVSCTSGCGDAPDSSGQLVRDPSFTNNPQRWLLPLSLETIPQLARVGTVAAQLKVSVLVTDGAGNVGSQRVDLPFHVVAPPLAWTEDTAYSAVADPKSVFAYRRSGVTTANYEQAFNAANPQLINGQARMVRYVVQNASAVPVAISVTPSSSAYSQVERWDDVTDSLGPSTNLLRYNHCFLTWLGPSFCASSPSSFKYQDYYPAADCSGIPSTIPSSGTVLGSEGAVASAPLGAAGFLNPQPAGGESTLAPTVSGAFVVPAASGTTPGKLVVYLTRPAAVLRSVSLTKQNVMSGGPSSLGSNAYSFRIEDFWSLTTHESCTTPDGFNMPAGTDVYTSTRHGRFLASAKTLYSGAVTFATAPLDASGGNLGETTPIALGYSASVAFTH